MSEELKANNYTKKGNPFGVYESYTIGATTLNGLKKYKIVPNLDYKNYGRRKPDGLIVDRRNKDEIKVIAVVEYKDPTDFDTQEKKLKAFRQCNNYCQVTGAEFGIATDTREYYYINPHTNEDLASETYEDDFGIKRSYSIIQNEDGYNLSHNLVKDLSDLTELNKSLALFSRVLKEINATNSKLIIERKLNPNNLAKNVWQSIWLASGENPDLCLSTFVEIFIFRYLSDLKILDKNEDGVPVGFDSVKNSGKDVCLKYYFNNVRGHIKALFPESEKDNTSIINGFILDARIKEHNHLFFNILTSFSSFLTNEKGEEIKLVNIDPEFKSRLYEDFLKRSISQKNWGQYFTPRNVVKAIIEVSGIEKLGTDAVVGDPACGVGGFLLEPLLTKITNAFSVKDGNLQSSLSFRGEDRDPKVIIMAKANMIIYLSEVLRDNPTLTKNFATTINEVFKSFHTSILGSLSTTKTDVYDLVMTNPPYVTKGIVNYKEAIKNDGKLKDYYYVNGMGVECFFIEKIVNELKPNGQGFIVIPDGLLNRVNDHKIREFIKKHCIIDGIISLPIGTFYSTQKKTYILAITKKESKDTHQTDKVFGYVVTTIGESLDVYRTPINDNDLKDFVRQFKYFKLDKNLFEPLTINCKTFDIDKFDPKTNWCIDRFWDKQSKIDLGIEEEINIVDIDEYHNQVSRVTNEIQVLNKSLGNIDKAIASLNPETKPFSLSDLFYIKQGDAYYTLKRIKENAWEGNIPVYSSNTKNDGILAHILKDQIKAKDKFYDYSLTWAIDGMAGQLFLRNEENKLNLKEDKYLFTLNNHCGVIIPKEKIDFFFSSYFSERDNKNYKNQFFTELEIGFDSITEKEDIIKRDKSFLKFYNSLVYDCPNEKSILEQFNGLKIKEDIVDEEDELILAMNSKLTTENIKLLNESKIESVILNPIQATKKDNLSDTLKKFKKYSNCFTEETSKLFFKEIFPLVVKYYSNRIEIDLRYVMKNVQPLFFQRTRAYGNKKLGTGQIIDIELAVPIDKDENFDLLTMEKISKEQDKLLNIKNEIIMKYSELGEMEVVIQ